MIPESLKERHPPWPLLLEPKSGEAFRLLVERIKDYAIFLLDPEGHVSSWNQGLQCIKGYTAAEIVGQHLSVFYTPEDVAAGLPKRLLEIATTEGHIQIEGWRVRKDGSRFWADVVITALKDDAGTLRGFVKVTRDLTIRKDMQDALSELSGRLLGLQEEERRRLMHELHDTTSPLLTSLTGKLYQAREYARSDPELGELLNEALAMAEATATLVRKVSSMLHPPLIEQSGLLPTLRWYIAGFNNRTGITVNSTLPPTMRRLPLDHEIVLFRVVQEHLRAAQDAGAMTVTLNLKARDQIELSVEANDGDWSGDKNDFRNSRSPSGALFAGMRERVRQLGGTLVVDLTRPNLTLRAFLPTQFSHDGRIIR